MPRRARSPAPKRPSSTPTADAAPLLCFPGGGTFFWWQLGAATALFEHYDLSDVTMSGFSAGALASALSRCSVDPIECHRLAWELAEGAGVFRNPLGLAFKWGRLVDAWLRALLPEDAAERCSGVVTIVLTIFSPRPHVARAASYVTRDELISCLMASTHIPWFMDGGFTRRVHTSGLRGGHGPTTVRAADGGCLEFFGLETPLSLMTHGQAAGTLNVVLDPLHDSEFMAACSANGWSMLKPYGTDEFIEYGRAFVEARAALGASGELAPLASRLRPDTAGRKTSRRARSQTRRDRAEDSRRRAGSLPSLNCSASGVTMRAYALQAAVRAGLMLAPLLIGSYALYSRESPVS